MSDAQDNASSIRVAWLAGPTTVHRWGAVLEPLLTGLASRGVHVMLCCPETSPVESLQGSGVDIRFYRQPWWILGAGKARQTVADHITHFNADVIHALEASMACFAADVAEQTGRPYVAGCYGMRDRRRLPRHDERLRGVIAASDGVRDVLQKRRGPAAAIHVVRPGVEAEGTAKQLPDNGRIVTILADAMGGNRAAMQAIVASYSELLNRDHDGALFIIDAGREERRLRRTARELGVSAEVTFADPQPETDYSEIIQGADIFVSSPTRGDLSLHTLQAMAAGVPVLAGPDAAADFVIDGETARMCSEMTAACVTDALTGMLADHGATHALAVGALGLIRQRHAPQKTADALATAYRAAIDGETADSNATLDESAAAESTDESDEPDESAAETEAEEEADATVTR